MKRGRIYFGIFLILAANIFCVSASLNVTMSDHGTNVTNKTTGLALSSGSLTIEIWDAAAGGNIVHNETFPTGISGGSWSVTMGENASNNLSLEFGKAYYKDYKINGEDLNFTNSFGAITDRQLFYSPLGDIAGTYIQQNSNVLISSLNATAKSFFADADFNNGWTNGGISIIGGKIYADTGFFYNLSRLNVNSLNINGSLFPYFGFENTFDIGNETLPWRNLWLGGNIRAGQGNFSGIIYYNNATPITALNSTLLALTINSTANIQTLLAGTNISSAFGINTTNNLQQLLNNTNMYFSTLGVGVSALLRTFHVIGDSLFNISGSQNFEISNTTNSSLFYVNGTNGFVGIGTNSPTQKLDINGNANVSGTIYGFVLWNYLGGLGMNSTANFEMLTVAKGTAMDSTNFQMLKTASSITKNLSTAGGWTAGTNGIGNPNATLINVWYHVFLLGQSANSSAVDIGFDNKTNAANLMNDNSGFDLYRRIGSIKTDANKNITKFIQNGDTFEWAAPPADTTTCGAAALRILSTPLGIITESIISVNFGQSALDAIPTVNHWNPALGATLPGLNGIGRATDAGVGFQDVGGEEFRVITSVNSTIYNQCAGTNSYALDTHGWVDSRGKNDGS